MMRPFVFMPKGYKKQPRRCVTDTDGSLEPLRDDRGRATTQRTVQRKQCRWPYGNPAADVVMCGRPIVTALYCAEHHRAAFPKTKTGGER